MYLNQGCVVVAQLSIQEGVRMFMEVIEGMKLLAHDNKLLVIWLCLMVTDVVSGNIVAGVFKRSGKSLTGALRSDVGFIGIAKKAVEMCVVMMAMLLGELIGIEEVLSGTLIMYSAMEAISIIENAGIMGIPVPKAIRDSLEVLKGDEEDVK